MSAETRRPLRWALLGSLALNVALGTALLLHVVGFEHYDRDRPRGARFERDQLPDPRHVRELLGEERGALVTETWRRHRPGVRAAYRALREARAGTRAALSAQPFDPARLEQSFAVLRQRDAETAAAVQAVVADVMRQLTPAERARVVATLPEPRPWRRRDERPDGNDARAERARAPEPAGAPPPTD